jgi:hypothetical protein
MVDGCYALLGGSSTRPTQIGGLEHPLVLASADE